MLFGRRSPHDQRRNQNEKGRDKNRKKVLTKRIKLCIISDVRRQKETAPCDEYMEKYSRGRRGAPAKGVGRLYRRESSNLSFSAKKDRQYRKVLPIFFVEEKCMMQDSANCRWRQLRQSVRID